MYDPFESARAAMVTRQLEARGIRDRRVLDAMGRIPRHLFVPEAQRDSAYEDGPLGIGFGQTISQPYIVALMSEALAVVPGDRVLEVGTGCGYQTAVLAALGATVDSVELVPALAAQAGETLAALGIGGVHLHVGDGYQGWPAAAPFARILVAAAPTTLPEALVAQLRRGGRMVIPVGPAEDQRLCLVTRDAAGAHVTPGLPVRFVPLVRPAGA